MLLMKLSYYVNQKKLDDNLKSKAIELVLEASRIVRSISFVAFCLLSLYFCIRFSKFCDKSLSSKLVTKSNNTLILKQQSKAIKTKIALVKEKEENRMCI